MVCSPAQRAEGISRRTEAAAGTNTAVSKVRSRGGYTSPGLSFLAAMGIGKLTQVGWAVLRYPAFFGSNKVKLTAESLATRGHFSVGAGSPHCGLTPSAGTWAPRHLLGRGGAASSLRLVEGKALALRLSKGVGGVRLLLGDSLCSRLFGLWQKVILVQAMWFAGCFQGFLRTR